jgi:hypothetical protein
MTDGIATKQSEIKVVQLLNEITRESQSTVECFNCPIDAGCGWCSGYNYDKFNTPNKRATFICEMHKARVMANVYFWNKYYRANNIEKRFPNNIPKEWALKIISEEEYLLLDYLASDLTADNNAKIDPTKFTDIITIPYSKNDIDQLYDSFMYNLKVLSKSPNYHVDMLSIKNIPGVDMKESWNTMGDKYLVSTANDHRNLGKSIIENGTYWPLVVRDDKNGKRLTEGGHRHTSLSLLINDGYIDDVEVPVLTITESSNTRPDWYYVVNPTCTNDEFKKRYASLYNDLFANCEYEVVNDYLLKVRGVNAYLAMMMIVILVRNMIHDQSLLDNEFYKPRIELNDKEAMQKYFYPER